MMLFSPLVFYKYLIFLVSVVVVFVALDVLPSGLLHDKLILTYAFGLGLASGAIGIMLITRRVYEQVAHPCKEHIKRKLLKEMDEVIQKRLQFEEEEFRKQNK